MKKSQSKREVSINLKLPVDPYRYIDSAVGVNTCAVCGRHEYGEDPHPQFFKAGGAGYIYHLPCLASLLAGYRYDQHTRRLVKLSDEGGGVF
jgi:hypothetical protein